MKYSTSEARDFKCKSCGMKWLSYIENNDPCRSVSEDQDGSHNFDFSKPIKRDTEDKDSANSTTTKLNDEHQTAQVLDSSIRLA